MDTKLLSACTGGEAHDASVNTRSVLSKIDFSADTILTKMISDLQAKESSLLNSIGIEKKSEHTAETSKFDSIFDSRLICFKMFTEANMNFDNPNIVANANKIWSKIEAHNPFLYKLSYEGQMTNALSLFTELDKEEYQVIMADLHGVKVSYELTKQAYTSLQESYQKGQEVKALKKKIIPSSVLKKDVTEIINDKLIPYLGLLAENQPETYENIFFKTTHYIDLVNQKIRTRRSRNENQDDDSNDADLS